MSFEVPPSASTYESYSSRKPMVAMRSRFSERAQAVIDGLNFLVSAVLFFLISWGSMGQAAVLKESESITTVLEIPLYPFLWVLAICSGLLGLVFLLQTFESFMGGAAK